MFLGVTKEALPLKGRKVRNRVALLSSLLSDPIRHSNERRDLPANAVGLLANAIGEQLLIAYSKTPDAQGTTLEA
ncbi:MAG: hypothetical protein AB7T38_17735 [Nitrospirales bacterium]